MDEIKIYELKRMDLRGAAVIDGFPSVGLVSTITANYLIGILQMEQIGILDSIHFPTVSVVRNSEPLNPVRIYAKTKIKEGEKQAVVFISEFQTPPNLIKLIAGTILDWMVEQGCNLLISPEGLVIDRGEVAGEDLSDMAEALDILIVPYQKLVVPYEIAREGIRIGEEGEGNDNDNAQGIGPPPYRRPCRSIFLRVPVAVILDPPLLFLRPRKPHGLDGLPHGGLWDAQRVRHLSVRLDAEILFYISFLGVW